MGRFALAALVALSLLPTVPATAAEEHRHHEAAAPQLSLNNGQKWTADKHTMDSVAEMSSLVEKAKAPPAQASVESLNTLGRQLQEKLQSLIRGCTMTGGAHDQLHTWISLLAPQIEVLMTSQNIEEQQAGLEKISTLLTSFNQHFKG